MKEWLNPNYTVQRRENIEYIVLKEGINDLGIDGTNVKKKP
jgi:hypothetical protein